MTVLATAVWRARPSGSNTNGGGYDPGIAGAATDYSQQNAAQATGTNGAGTATTTFTDATAAAFTSAMVGNAINITGQGFYFVTAFLTASTVTVDRALGTFSGATWHLGGGWADFYTNPALTGPVVPGNIVYVLGSGTPNPASYTYDYSPTGRFNPASGNDTAGFISWLNDPATPGYKAPPDTTGGMPTVKIANDIFFNAPSYGNVSGLWFISSAAGSNVFAGPVNTTIFGCVYDQFGKDTYFTQAGPSIAVIGCEVFSSVAPGAAGSNFAISTQASLVSGCNVHDVVGGGIFLISSTVGGTILSCIIAKCQTNGIEQSTVSGVTRPISNILNNTIDGNLLNGIVIDAQDSLSQVIIMNNIISNHTTAGKFGLTISAGTAAANSRVQQMVDYNVYYNNTADLNAINYGPHDTHGGSNPYVAQSTENYTLA